MAAGLERREQQPADDVLAVGGVDVAAAAVDDAVEHADLVGQPRREVAVDLDADVAVRHQRRRQRALDEQDVGRRQQPLLAERRLLLAGAQVEDLGEARVEVGVLHHRGAAAEVGHDPEVEDLEERRLDDRTRPPQQERVDAAVVVVAAVVAAVGVQVAADAEAEGAVGRAELEAAGAGHRRRARSPGPRSRLPSRSRAAGPGCGAAGRAPRCALRGSAAPPADRQARSPARPARRGRRAGVWAAAGRGGAAVRRAASATGASGRRTDDGTWITTPAAGRHVHRDASQTTVDTTPTAITGASRTRGDRASARRSRELGCEETNGPVPAADAAATSYLQRATTTRRGRAASGVMPPTRWTGAVGGK